jgi:26S proteasome regulatory subunit N3
LRDVASKLHLNSTIVIVDAKSIVTKAIQDGGNDASVDHNKGWMQSKETGDIYSTQVKNL